MTCTCDIRAIATAALQGKTLGPCREHEPGAWKDTQREAALQQDRDRHQARLGAFEAEAARLHIETEAIAAEQRRDAYLGELERADPMAAAVARRTSYQPPAISPGDDAALINVVRGAFPGATVHHPHDDGPAAA